MRNTNLGARLQNKVTNREVLQFREQPEFATDSHTIGILLDAIC